MRLSKNIAFHISILIGLNLGLMAVSASAASKKVAGGATQVVANVNGREITLTELRSEMARLGVSPAAPDAERYALQNLVNRVVLFKAARDADVHRRPEALLLTQAAQEQALADLYLSIAAQALEPTRQEINDFITANPTLFEERRRYEFSVLTLPTDAFNEEEMTPLFDEAKTFDGLRAALDDADIRYTLTGSIQPSSAFPQAIREQLSRYSAGDNIILKSDPQTQVMKIMSKKRERLPSKDWPVLARQYLLEQSGATRANEVMERLRSQAKVKFFRASAAPLPQGKQNRASAEAGQ